MGARAVIEIDDDALRRALRALIAYGEDPAPVLDEIGAALVERTQERFERGEAPGGAKWRPSERALKQGGKTLVDTARLMQSINHQVTGNAVEWGTNVVYAAIHQFGGETGRKNPRAQTLAFGKDGRFAARDKFERRKTGAVRIAIAQLGAGRFQMPARPYLGFDDTDRRIVDGILTDRLTEALAGGGLA